MTTQIGERFWTYYGGGQYECSCFFCKHIVGEDECRWHSANPTSVYACNHCFEGNRILPGLYPETHQASFVVEKAVEVPVTAYQGTETTSATPTPDYAPTAKETRIMSAHDENMESARMLRSVLSCLVSAIVDLTGQLEAMNK